MKGKSLLLVLPTTSLLYSVYIGTSLLDSTKTTLVPLKEISLQYGLLAMYISMFAIQFYRTIRRTWYLLFKTVRFLGVPQLGCSKFDYLKFRCRNFLNLGVRIKIVKQYLLVKTSAQWITACINSFIPNDRKRRSPIHFTALKSIPDGSYILPAFLPAFCNI